MSKEASVSMPLPLRAYIALTAIAGTTLLVYLAQTAEWSASNLTELGVFTLMVVLAGSFPLTVTKGVKADISTAVLFSAAVLLEPGAAVVAATVGMLSYSLIVRYLGERLHLPGYNYPLYKYPFNIGETVLSVGLTSVVFHALVSDGALMTPAVIIAAGIKYLTNSALVSGAVSIQTRQNPLSVWRTGTKEIGLGSLSQLAFGFLGAVVYQESPWMLVALFIPVGTIYVAFSRLGRKIGALDRGGRERAAECTGRAGGARREPNGGVAASSRRAVGIATPDRQRTRRATQGGGEAVAWPRTEPSSGCVSLASCGSREHG